VVRENRTDAQHRPGRQRDTARLKRERRGVEDRRSRRGVAVQARCASCATRQEGYSTRRGASWGLFSAFDRKGWFRGMFGDRAAERWSRAAPRLVHQRGRVTCGGTASSQAGAGAVGVGIQHRLEARRVFRIANLSIFVFFGVTGADDLAVASRQHTMAAARTSSTRHNRLESRGSWSVTATGPLSCRHAGRPTPPRHFRDGPRRRRMDSGTLGLRQHDTILDRRDRDHGRRDSPAIAFVGLRGGGCEFCRAPWGRVHFATPRHGQFAGARCHWGVADGSPQGTRVARLAIRYRRVSERWLTPLSPRAGVPSTYRCQRRAQRETNAWDARFPIVQ